MTTPMKAPLTEAQVEAEYFQPTPLRDKLVSTVLVGLGLAVLVAIVFVCLPDKSLLSRMFARHSARPSQTHSQKQSAWAWSSSSKASSGQNLEGRKLVSYNNPLVRRTLDLPWAR